MNGCKRQALQLVLVGTLVFAVESSMASTKVEDDKMLHSGAVFGVYMASYVLLGRHKYNKWDRMTGALALSTSVGLIKEIVDPVFSVDDLRADLIGAGAGFTLTFIFDW